MSVRGFQKRESEPIRERFETILRHIAPLFPIYCLNVKSKMKEMRSRNQFNSVLFDDDDDQFMIIFQRKLIGSFLHFQRNIIVRGTLGLLNLLICNTVTKNWDLLVKNIFN